MKRKNIYSMIAREEEEDLWAVVSGCVRETKDEEHGNMETNKTVKKHQRENQT